MGLSSIFIPLSFIALLTSLFDFNKFDLTTRSKIFRPSLISFFFYFYNWQLGCVIINFFIYKYVNRCF